MTSRAGSSHHQGDPIPLLVIGGPTASGKTEAAVSVGEAVAVEIVSADSMQIYRHMDIGTAKPTPGQRARVPFHLVDFMEPGEPYTVADFQRDAKAAILDIHERGRLPVLCGGTGLYVDAVLRHLDFPPHLGTQQAEIRERLDDYAEMHGPAAMHRLLAEADPAAGDAIEVNDRKRIIRALEVIEGTGRRFSELRRIDETPTVNYNSVCFVLTRPRPVLYEAIERRVDEMLEAGWLDEVKALRERGCGSADQAMQAIGYRHLMGYLQGGGDLAETVRLIKRDTRRFAKRQLTWFGGQTRRNELAEAAGSGRALQWLEWTTREEFADAVQQMTRAANSLQAKHGL